MNESKVNSKEISKKLKEQKAEEKKIFNFNLKKSTGLFNESNKLNSNLILFNKNDSKTTNNNEKVYHLENIFDSEKNNLQRKQDSKILKKNGSSNQSFSEKGLSEYDDEWRNLNELVKYNN